MLTNIFHTDKLLFFHTVLRLKLIKVPPALGLRSERKIKYREMPDSDIIAEAVKHWRNMPEPKIHSKNNHCFIAIFGRDLQYELAKALKVEILTGELAKSLQAIVDMTDEVRDKTLLHYRKTNEKYKTDIETICLYEYAKFTGDIFFYNLRYAGDEPLYGSPTTALSDVNKVPLTWIISNIMPEVASITQLEATSFGIINSLRARSDYQTKIKPLLKNNALVDINGHLLRSRHETLIANCLILNNINFKYEGYYMRGSEFKFKYDFKLSLPQVNGDIFIEAWMTTKEIAQQSADNKIKDYWVERSRKIKFFKDKGLKVIELECSGFDWRHATAKEFVNFIAPLITYLDNAGIPLTVDYDQIDVNNDPLIQLPAEAMLEYLIKRYPELGENPNNFLELLCKKEHGLYTSLNHKDNREKKGQVLSELVNNHNRKARYSFNTSPDLTLEDFRQILSDLNITTKEEYRAARRNGSLAGMRYDAEKQFKSTWAEIFGREPRRPRCEKIELEDFYKILAEKGIETCDEYNRYRGDENNVEAHKLPPRPDKYFAKKGWRNWDGWKK